MPLAELRADFEGVRAFGPTDRVAIRPQRRVVKVSGLAAGDGNRVEWRQPDDERIPVLAWKETLSVVAVGGIVERAVASPFG